MARSESIDRRSELTKSPPLTASDAADAQSISGSSFTASVRGDFSDSASTRSASSAEVPRAHRPTALRPAQPLPVLQEEAVTRPWAAAGSNLIPGLLSEDDDSLFPPALSGSSCSSASSSPMEAPTAPGMAHYGSMGMGMGMMDLMEDELGSGMPPFFPAPVPTHAAPAAPSSSSSCAKRERALSMDSLSSSSHQHPARHVDMGSDRSSSPLHASPSPVPTSQAGAGAATPAVGNKRTRRGSGGGHATGGGHALPLPASLALCLGMALCLTMGPSPTTLGPSAGSTGGEEYGYLPADMDDVGRARGEGAGSGYEYLHGSGAGYGRATYILPGSFSVSGEGISATGGAASAKEGEEEEGQRLTASAATSAPPAAPLPARAPVSPRKLPLAASLSGWALPPPAVVANVLMKLLPARGKEEGNASAAPQPAGNGTADTPAGAHTSPLPSSSSSLLSDVFSWLPSPPPFLSATPAVLRPRATGASHHAAAHALAIMDPWLEPSLWPGGEAPLSPLGRLCMHVPVQAPERPHPGQGRGMDKAVALPSPAAASALALPAPGGASPRSLTAAEERSLATLADLLRAHHQHAQGAALPALPAPDGSAPGTSAPVAPAVTLPAPGTPAEAELQAALAVALPALAARAGITAAQVARMKVTLGAGTTAGGAVAPILCIDRPGSVPTPGAQAAACLAFLLAASGFALPTVEGSKEDEAEEDVEQGLRKAGKRARLGAEVASEAPSAAWVA